MSRQLRNDRPMNLFLADFTIRSRKPLELDSFSYSLFRSCFIWFLFKRLVSLLWCLPYFFHVSLQLGWFIILIVLRVSYVSIPSLGGFFFYFSGAKLCYFISSLSILPRSFVSLSSVSVNYPFNSHPSCPTLFRFLLNFAGPFESLPKFRLFFYGS